jgi:hypothetical protein
MLYFDFRAVFKARNISNPYGVMLQQGFTKRVAYQYANLELKNIKLDHLYKICRICNCTPNDVIRYKPGNNDSLSETHALNRIKGAALTAEANELLKNLSLEELNGFANLLMKKKSEVV